MLQRLEILQGEAILATNLPANLDETFLRLAQLDVDREAFLVRHARTIFLISAVT